MLVWLLSFDGVKDRLAQLESSHGRYKVHFNFNATCDAGIWQINSRHFVEKDTIGREFDRVFEKWGIGGKLHERVVAAIQNDSLNEDLARKLFEIRGIRAWVSARKQTE